MALVLVSIAWLASPAMADRIQGPPTDCPPGTRGESDHRGPYCTPIACTTDAECEGATCRDVMLCSAVTRGPAGRSEIETERTEVYGTCEGGASCARGTCNRTRACAPGEAPPDDDPNEGETAMQFHETPMLSPQAETTEEDDSSCSVGSSGAWLVGLGLVVLLFVRRRRST
jgi:MYXO-CTERM domain-containing protein